MLFDLLERYMNIQRPELGVPNGLKIVCLDLQGSEDYCTVDLPMTPDHPLYPRLTALGGCPEQYPLEIYRPLVFTGGLPNLLYKQPNVVKPFTICLQDLTVEDWRVFLSDLTPAQSRLHDAVLREAQARPNWSEITLDDLYVIAQTLMSNRRMSFSRNIKGMKNAEPIPLASYTYSSREAAGLLQHYEKLMDLSVIMPEQWNGKLVETNLNMRSILEKEVTWEIGKKERSLWPISVFLLPDVANVPFLNYAIANYVLTRLFWMKAVNNAARTIVPVSLALLEATRFAPRLVIDKSQRQYIEPVRSTVLKIAQQGSAFGIHLSTDTSSPMDVHEGLLDTIEEMKIFDLGSDMAYMLQNLLRGHYLDNYGEITDENSRLLTSLRDLETYLHIGIGSVRGELGRGAICGVWYPRVAQLQASFYELHKEYGKLGDWTDIRDLYAMVKTINTDSQKRAADTMRDQLSNAVMH